MLRSKGAKETVEVERKVRDNNNKNYKNNKINNNKITITSGIKCWRGVPALGEEEFTQGTLAGRLNNIQWFSSVTKNIFTNICLEYFQNILFILNIREEFTQGINASHLILNIFCNKIFFHKYLNIFCKNILSQIS